MAIRFYDDALYNKIQKWIKDPNLTILKPDETNRLLRIKLDEGNDQPIRLPFIALSRTRDIEILNTNKQVKTFDGYNLIKNEKMAVPINVIPIRIGYQLDIYTRYMAEADEYIRNFVFNFVNYPKLKVVLPYNDLNLEHLSNIWLGSTVSDNSDIEEHMFPDQFTRFTLNLEIDDAYLFSLPIQTPATIEEAEFEVRDRTTMEIVESGKIYPQDS